MRKYLKRIIVILIFIIIGYFGCSIIQKIKQKNITTQHIQNIPEFSFKTLDNTDFTKNDLDRDKPKLIIYFNSECEFCQSEAIRIQKNLIDFKGIQLVFISYEPIEKIRSFAEQYKLLNKENVIFLEGEKLFFVNSLDVKKFPYMLLYSKEGKLIKEFKGATKIEIIIKAL